MAIRPGAGGVPLLLCNGLGANLELLRPFANKLSDREVITFDAPGVGRSSTPLLPYRFAGLAGKVIRFLDQLGYDTFNVLGISWGGGLAQELALQRPDRVKKLILAATGPGTFMVPGRLSAMIRLLSPRRYYEPSYLVNAAGDIYGGIFRDDPKYAHRHAGMAQPPAGIGYLWQLTAIAGWTSIHRLHKIKQPTLILAGEDDPLVPVINSRVMGKLIPNSTVEILPCGHLFLMTRPEQAVQIVESFIDSH